MFTGLIADLGEVLGAESSPDGVRLRIASRLTGSLRDGDSVAVNGVCLTATEVGRSAFAAEVMNLTLQRSSLQGAQPGVVVNLELPLRPSDHLGGHIVQGHVDGIGTVSEVVADGFARRVRITASSEVLRYVVAKGSIAVDGISLTVAEVDGSSFTVSLIPATLHRTNLGTAQAGRTVNLEVDLVAKYVEKLVSR